MKGKLVIQGVLPTLKTTKESNEFYKSMKMLNSYKPLISVRVHDINGFLFGHLTAYFTNYIKI